MASKPDTSAQEPEVSEAQAAEPAAVEQQPEAAVEVASAQPEDPASESIVEEIRDEAEKVIHEIEHVAEEVKAEFLKMIHPDNGSSDQYDKDADGNLIVPAADVASMADHGFTVVGTVQS